jgi:putative transposase
VEVARRAGIEIGRDQTRRLMAKAGSRARDERGGSARPAATRTRAGTRDLVNRQFHASRPIELWVTDLTFVLTWARVAYVCFIIDAFSRMIVGWR